MSKPQSRLASTEAPPPSLKTFAMLWSGQLVSSIGSEMTTFALTLWAWDRTGQATPLALILFFTQTPKVCAAVFAGVLVDTYDRQRLMLVSDLMVGIMTVILLLLFLSQRLEIWQLYVTSIVNGLSGYLQNLAYSTTIPSIVPKVHYARATAMDALKQASAYVFSPAIAGVLYPLIGFVGILSIDLATLAIAMISLGLAVIPRRKATSSVRSWQPRQLTFGFQYIFQRSGLLAILLFLLAANLFTSASFALWPAFILARSGNDAMALASVRSAFGCGGLLGAAVLSIFGSPQPRIHGLLLGVALPQIGLIVLALGRNLSIWIGAAFIAAFFVPMLGSANQAIWLAKVESTVQGKVFAARFVIAQLSSPLGYAIAGPLADRLFEPALESGSWLASVLSPWLGTGAGTGIALQLILLGICNLTVGFGGYGVPVLRNVEAMPDCESPLESSFNSERN
ncbi:MAG: MFS transporter [Cyanophyceae cyanobacterium]